ncbi:MAG TPA: methyltransferase domain-containing protein [Dongiaceae bacterium]|jgi:hypothetical protein
MQAYSQEFYANRYANTVHSAQTILGILLARIPPVHSAVDIGCGVGAWLSVLRDQGLEVQGVDGPWVDQNLLAIPRDRFKQIDLSSASIALPRRYDLAMSLEVAEHLPPARAGEFVSSLTALSDYVLFSAATPFQGGVNHFNEQWQHYWVDLFSARGYVVHDFIRQRIWNDPKMPFWYRQNILFFSTWQKASTVSVDVAGADALPMPLDVVHPDLFLRRATAAAPMGVKSSLKHFRRSLGGYFNRKLGGAG